MLEIVTTVSISTLLVVIEALGLILSKWTIAKRQADRHIHEAVAKAALEYDKRDLDDTIDPVAALADKFENVADTTRREYLSNAVATVAPGPEACFLAMTIIATLFLAFNYSNESVRMALSPMLAASSSAFPILFGVFLLTLSAWLGTLMWREALAVGLQRQRRRLSIMVLMFVGGFALSICVFLVIADRL